jgi:prepilin-type processing-associated H-X9-DG protein
MRLPRFRLRLRTLLAAVALSAIMLAIGIMVIGKGGEGQEDPAQAQCAYNLKQLGFGLFSYESSCGAFPAGTVINEGLPATHRLSWLTAIFGFLDQIHLLTDPSEPWDGGANRVPMIRFQSDESIGGFATEPLGDFDLAQCPAHRHRAQPGPPSETDYVGIAGLGVDAPSLPVRHPRAGFFGYDRQTRIVDIKDGISQTMMIAETSDANGPWTAGGPATVRGLDPSRRPYIGRGRQFGGMHRGGAAVLFADGSVRLIRETIDPAVFEALSTIVGRESVPSDW